LTTQFAYLRIGYEEAVPGRGALPPGDRRAGRTDVQTIYTDVVVVGGGLAGLRAAIGARRRGLEVIDAEPGAGQALALRGGAGRHAGESRQLPSRVAATTKTVHFADTVRGSDWGADQRVVRMFAETAPEGHPRAGGLGRALEPRAARRSRGRHQRRAGDPQSRTMRRTA
jgi:succinate dehydrogenase/fumarate reductase flavoprotein subunit